MMTNKEMIIELQYAIDLIKQNGQDWLDERDIPILEGAISALQAQEAKHSNESSLTQKALDTISRQAVISYIDRIMHQGTGKNKSFEYIKKYVEKLQSAQPDVPDINVGDMISREELFEELNCINLPVGNEIVDKIFSVIENIPSAQPYKSDLIERQRAIDELISEPPEMNYGFYYAEKIKALPSAQPEISRMVIGKPSGGTTMWYECEGCGEPVDPGDRYCRKCGRKLINE